ncbi:MAG: hypothetical protein R6X19_10525 [Kiritimatiellia bacterium]
MELSAIQQLPLRLVAGFEADGGSQRKRKMENNGYLKGKNRLMDQAGRDVAHVLTWRKTLGANVLQAKPIALLTQVFEENFELIDGSTLQRIDQPPRAAHNPHDPEARWGKKGNPHREWAGYKTQMAETVPDRLC